MMKKLAWFCLWLALLFLGGVLYVIFMEELAWIPGWKILVVALAATAIIFLVSRDTGKKTLQQQQKVRHHTIRSEANRPNRLIRWLVLLGTMLAIPAVIGGLLHITIGSWLKFEGSISLLYILALFPAGEIMARIMPRFWVTIPQMQFFVTYNPIRNILGGQHNPNITYTAGDEGPSLPWERRTEEGNGSLEVMTIEWDDKVPGEETEFILDGSYQFRVDNPDRFIGIDEQTIRAGVIDLIKADAASRLAEKTGDKGKNEIKGLNDDLYREFGGDPNTPKDRRVTEFEDEYGIETFKVTVASIDFPDPVQKTRNARDEARQVMIGVANLYGMRVDILRQKVESGEIPTEEYNEMLDRFAAFSDNAKMDIKAFKINNPSQFAQAFANAFASLGGK